MRVTATRIPDLARTHPYALAWAGLALYALATHLWDLGGRSLGYDESLHAYYSWLLADRGQYTHNPMMHGPLLFHVSGALFWLLGDSEFTARLPVALAGTALVLLPFLFRRVLGRAGALFAGGLLAVSPSLLFYGRYLRNDVYMAVLTLFWAWLAWRYLETRRSRFLIGLAGIMALAFACKETAFIFGAFLGAYCLGLFLWRLKNRPGWSGRGGDPSWGPPLDLALVMGLLVLPFLTPFLHLLLGWDPVGTGSRDLTRTYALTAAALVLAAGAGWIYFTLPQDDPLGPPRPGPLAWFLAFCLFYVITVLLYSTFFSNTRLGLASGAAGSLGYWLRQHGVNRGGQPWYFYLLLCLIYEPAALFGSLGGAAALLRRRLAGWKALAPDNPWKQPFPWFLLLWSLSAWLGYSLAGERMPWLVTHIALPMCLLAGWWMGRLWEWLDWPLAQRSGGWLLMPLAAGLGVALTALLVQEPFRGRELAQIAATARWLGALLAGLALPVLGWLALKRARAWGWSRPRQAVALGLLGVLALVSLRAGINAALVAPDSPRELLFYAHGSPSLKPAVARARRAVLDRNGQQVLPLGLALDGITTWPLAWYFRDLKNQTQYSEATVMKLAGAGAILADPSRQGKLAPVLAQRAWDKTVFLSITWPIKDYDNLTWRSVLGALFTREGRRRVWEVFWNRDYPQQSLVPWPLRREVFLYVPAPGAPPPPAPASVVPPPEISPGVRVWQAGEK